MIRRPELPGVEYVHSLPELPGVCGGRAAFFDRPAPEGYLADWSRGWPSRPALDAERRGYDEEDDQRPCDEGEAVSVLIFRLGEEWLAFRTQTVAEVTLPGPCTGFPTAPTRSLTGIGEPARPGPALRLAARLTGADCTGASPRLVVLRDPDRAEIWAFAADEVLGVQRVPQPVARVPLTLVNPAVGFSQAVLSWNERSIGLLDEQRVFSAIRSLGPLSGDLSGFSMMELFRMEAESHTATLSAGLVALEGVGLARSDRPAHACGSLAQGAARLSVSMLPLRVAHAMEDCFVAVQKGKLVLQSEHVDILLRGVDLLAPGRPARRAGVEPWQSEHAD